ncbi:MarR family transcriptional regulator [Weissella viridescens]|uniref:MarR family transcriptional regulator n=1 Tax=Weissella viridescens TaxID=1629 RepID=A0A3P2RC73_WEIVI|nr:MarR family transcriptional regulator [Weissella viridescens]RRG18203.1 MarR family transcriptional regulator [Weissella viridescens]
MKTILNALQDANKTYQAELLQLAKTNQVTLAEWHLLDALAQGWDTQDKLAQAMKLDHSTLSRQLKALGNKGLVESEAISRDNRQLKYTLSENGTTVLATLTDQAQAYSKQIFSVWSEDEQQMMKILLNRLENSLAKNEIA